MNDKSVSRRVLVLKSIVLGLILLAIALPLPASAQEIVQPADAKAHMAPALSDDITWLEPRGLSVLDFVGQVPEEHLRDSILIFGQAGVTKYLRGERVGNLVTIEVSADSWLVDHQGRLRTEIPCLGRRPIFDEWPVPVPESTMRVYSDGVDVTDQVLPWFAYTPAQQAFPITGSAGYEGLIRYHYEKDARFTYTDDGDIIVPPNMGCHIWLPGRVPNLTMKFVFNYPPKIHIEPLGQETFTFHSYIGIGHAGELESLRDQMVARYDIRHDKFTLNPPAGTDYVWLNYPATPVSLYATELTEENIRLPFGGTYRFIGTLLSNDHVVSMGLPLYEQWRDSDLDDGSWLSRIGPITRISSPEYFVPPGIGYDPCMRFGGCPATLLEEIYNQEAQMTLHYYRVQRLPSSNLMKIPLYPVGPDWQPGDTPRFDERLKLDVMPLQTPLQSVEPAVTQASHLTTDSAGSADELPVHKVSFETIVVPAHRVLLPQVAMAPLPSYLPEEPPQAQCPCGWFDNLFRMLDTVPGLPLPPPPP